MKYEKPIAPDPHRPQGSGILPRARALITLVAIVLVVVVIVLAQSTSESRGLAHSSSRDTGSATDTPVTGAAAAGSSSTPTGGGSKSAEILFSSSESWGPCQQSGLACAQEETLYADGQLVLKGDKTETRRLTPAIMGQIKAQLLRSGIMTKNCTADMVADRWGTYEIHLGGNSKEIHFPGCSEDVETIQRLIEQ